MRGVDFHPPHHALQGQLDVDPIVSRPAPPPRFPAIAHVRRAAGHDQVVFRAEEHVAAAQHLAAVLGRGEIDLLAEPSQAVPVGDDFAVHAERLDGDTWLVDADPL